MRIDFTPEKEWIQRFKQDLILIREKLRFKEEMAVNEAEIKLPVLEKELEKVEPVLVTAVTKVAPIAVTFLKRSGHMNWAQILQMVLNLTPYVAAGVEVIHSGESTETKTQITQQVLNVAVAGATSVLSQTNAAQAQAIGSAVSAIITAATTKPTPAPQAAAPATIPAPTPISS